MFTWPPHPAFHSGRKPLGVGALRPDAMVRLGFVIGLVVPLVLLGVNLALNAGGILVTIALLVWLGTGILLTPTPEEER
jgi:hypothetical protein